MITQECLVGTWNAGEDFEAADQYKAVKVYSSSTDANQQVVLCGAGDSGLGILQQTDDTGHPVQVVTRGSSKAVAGAAVTIGAYLKADSAGRLIPVTSNNDHYIAKAVTAASNADEVFAVEVGTGIYGA